MLNTRTYRKLFRDTARQHGVELLSGNWTDGCGGSGHKIVSNMRKVTFKVNTDSGDFDSFLTDLTVQTKLINGTAPRFTAPRKDVEAVLMQNGHYSHWERKESDHNFTYIKMNVRAS